MAMSPYEQAASKRPDKRSAYEQSLVDKAYRSGIISAENLDHEAKRRQKYGLL